ncbi:NAD(P)/FAD-dependent oxidoreductase [Selenomonas sp.]|uniref:NAD(P)/FAD-dependent oxidoreductase n=1 Tax=Selenomonas sp. TaxID=2053611 RepID=UPI003FA20398
MAKETIQKDIIIIGAGMAGLTAALYAGRMNFSTLVLENAIVGGQIANATGIENYPGFLSVAGADLIKTVQQQAESFGAVVDEFDAIEKVDLSGAVKRIETDGAVYETPVVIIASGMSRKKLPLAEEAKYAGRGVHYCELCDGHMYQDKIIAVMGGGNAALDAANFLSRYAKKLYLIHRSKMRADDVSQKRLMENPKAEILLETEIRTLKGEGKLRSVEIFDKKTNETRDLPVDAIFVNIGVQPNTALFTGQVEINAKGHIVAGEDCRTKIAGVFAAGDIREKEIHQLTTAAADGTTAALLAEKYITGGKTSW